MARLRAVGPGETGEQPAPATMAEATERSRRVFLVRSRLQIADVIDGGVPPHALGRLIAEMDRIDTEIRRLDASEQKESERGAVVDGSFDAAAI